MKSVSDPSSPVAGLDNLVKTCEQCHKGAGVNFASSFLGHKEASPGQFNTWLVCKPRILSSLSIMTPTHLPFEVAIHGIVGDLFEVVPMMIAKLKNG